MLPKTIQSKVYDQYKNEINFRFTNEDVPYCHVPEKIIYLKLTAFLHPTKESVFDMLHEIGHIMTNKPKMKRYEEEYHATVWAIKEAKKYNLKVTKKRRQEYQNYIWNWRDSSIKRKGKNILSKEEVTLEW